MVSGQSPSRSPRPSPLAFSGPDIPPPVRPAGAAPIVITGTMGAADQRYFDALRAAHFPPERNWLAAHITLFHQLPPSALDEIDSLLRTIAADTPPPAARIAGVYSLGSGVAFRIDSPELAAIRERMVDHFQGLLTAQDRGVPRLHITVQNKVPSAAARALLAELQADFHPRALAVTGLAAHRYLGGPWDRVLERKFRGGRR